MKVLHIIGADLSKKTIDFASPQAVNTSKDSKQSCRLPGANELDRQAKNQYFRNDDCDGTHRTLQLPA